MHNSSRYFQEGKMGFQWKLCASSSCFHLSAQAGRFHLFLMSLLRDIICMYEHLSFHANSKYHAHCSSFSKAFYFVCGCTQLANSVVIVSGDRGRGVQPYMYTYPLSPKPHSHPGCRSIGQGFLCCTVGPCWLSSLNIAVCSHLSQTP